MNLHLFLSVVTGVLASQASAGPMSPGMPSKDWIWISSVSAEVQKSISEHCQIGVGYEFADWGKSELGRAFGQTLNTGIGTQSSLH